MYLLYYIIYNRRNINRFLCGVRGGGGSAPPRPPLAPPLGWRVGFDENHKAFKDPLHIPIGPITKARSKKIKEALNGLIQEIWADSNTWHSKLDPKENEGVINLIQAIEGWSALIERDLWCGLMADWLSNPILVNSHFSYSETYYFRPNPP